MDSKPWFPIEAINFLDSVIKPDHSIFEYGSGGSTIYFAQRARLVVSVDHDPAWYRDVQNELKIRGIMNCACLLIEPELNQNGVKFGTDNLNGYATGHQPLANYNFRKYASIIDAFEPFDIVSIDGRSRPSCIKHAKEKLKLGGYLILDNSDRPYYKPAIQLIDSVWPRTKTTNSGKPETENIIWQKPQE
jgi:hypothetical protein